MKYIDVDGTRTAISTEGSGSPLVLLHGLGCSHRYFEGFQRELAATHTVFAPDLPGHGLSPSSPESMIRVSELTDWVAQLFTRLKLADAVVVGHSLGGGVALDLAARYPQLVRGLVLLAPTGVPDGMPLWEQIVRVVADGPLEPLRLYPRIVPAYLRAGPRRMWRLAVDQQRQEQRQQLRRIKAPVLVLRGSRDPVVTRAAMAELVETLPHASYHEIPGAAHALHINNPPSIASIVTQFTEGLPKRPRRRFKLRLMQ